MLFSLKEAISRRRQRSASLSSCVHAYPSTYLLNLLTIQLLQYAFKVYFRSIFESMEAYGSRSTEVCFVE